MVLSSSATSAKIKEGNNSGGGRGRDRNRPHSRRGAGQHSSATTSTSDSKRSLSMGRVSGNGTLIPDVLGHQDTHFRHRQSREFARPSLTEEREGSNDDRDRAGDWDPATRLKVTTPESSSPSSPPRRVSVTSMAHSIDGLAFHSRIEVASWRGAASFEHDR
ncbi:hypothetical protein EV182_004606, partial [Spiromyces aspiralis]